MRGTTPPQQRKATVKVARVKHPPDKVSPVKSSGLPQDQQSSTHPPQAKITREIDRGRGGQGSDRQSSQTSTYNDAKQDMRRFLKACRKQRKRRRSHRSAVKQIYTAIASLIKNLDIKQERKSELTSFINESLSKIKKRSIKRAAHKKRLRCAYDMLEKDIINSGASHSLHWDVTKLSNQQSSPDISHV